MVCPVLQRKTKKWDTAKSTGKTDKEEARDLAAVWRENGIPEKDTSRPLSEIENISTIFQFLKYAPFTETEVEKIVQILKDRNFINHAILPETTESKVLTEFLHTFWDYETSPYVREKLTHKHTMGKRHCYDMQNADKNYWKPFFENKLLGEITRQDLKAFSIWLSEEKQLAYKTVNIKLSVGTVALRWAFNNELIEKDIVKGLVKFSGNPKERGILRKEEANTLFTMKWGDIRAKLGNMLASCTGMRAGEVLALRVCDIGENEIFVRHSFSNQDGIKSTKTGKPRKPPLIVPELRRALLKLAKQNPNGVGPTTFVFWSFNMPDRPMDFHFLNDNLKKQLKRMNPQENWQKRNIVFHSWRHFYATCVSEHTEEKNAMTATGHNTQAVFRAFANHENEKIFQEVSRATEKAFQPGFKGVTHE